ncbi:general transcription factor 3C polypeptide 1 [Microplitis mediator]|uniref:general transcription factor 3C polypeptide 1 n=1 Tax=Microplitis mediator TaxID=375433 RepID=UPI002556CBC4|nr:general transcription factor 3C polypeptide 1 [Microplitis mediator]
MHLTQVDSAVYAPSTNLVDIVIDEVALEGLDGITLEALWKRLSLRLQMQDEFPKSFKEQVWTICTSTRGIYFYELESPRPPLVIYDRYEYVDPDLGIITEPDDIPDDIYEFHPVDDVKNGIQGSCKGYHTRKLIESTDSLTLREASKKYGSTLVIVGSQEIRHQALIGDCVCPTLEMNVVQYCFLERVGRSRYHGEVTQGKHSLSILNEDPKSLFYYRKLLLKHKLITKQVHYQKTLGHGSASSLLHLPRFYVERKPKMVYLAERIIDILKSRDNYLADYKEIKKELQIENSIKRLFKTSFFQKVVKTDLIVPYRVLYPDAPDYEWQRKACPAKEKRIRAVQLVDPNADVNNLWNKDELVDDEESYDLDVSNQLLFEPLLKQANAVVERANVNGISQRDLGVQMGMTKLQSRTILRNLSKLNVIGTYMDDSGRQRIGKFVSKKFEKGSTISKQFNSEIRKMKKLAKDSLNDSVNQTATTAMDFFYPLGTPDDNINNTDNRPTETNYPIEFNDNQDDQVDDENADNEPPDPDDNIIINHFETVDVDDVMTDHPVNFKRDNADEQTVRETGDKINIKVNETVTAGDGQENTGRDAQITARDYNVNIEMEIENTPIKLEALNVDRYHLFSVVNKILKKYANTNVKNKGKVRKRSKYKVGYFNIAQLDVSKIAGMSRVNRRRVKVKSADVQNQNAQANIPSSVDTQERNPEEIESTSGLDTQESVVPESTQSIPSSATQKIVPPENIQPNPSADAQNCILPENINAHPPDTQDGVLLKNIKTNPDTQDCIPLENIESNISLDTQNHILPERINSNLPSRKRQNSSGSIDIDDFNAKRIKISSNLFHNQEINTEVNTEAYNSEENFNHGFYNPEEYYNAEGYNPEEYYNAEGYNPEEQYNAEGYNTEENYNAEGYNPEENYNIEDNYDKSWLDDEEKIIDVTTTSTAFTYRTLKRLNLIITVVKELKIIDDPTKLMKMINEEEEREGYEVKMDKKSLMRMLQRLARDNLVKNMKLTLSANNRKKVLFFVCDTNINVNHSVIQSAVEQAKIKFCLMPSPKKKSVKMINNEQQTDANEKTVAADDTPTEAESQEAGDKNKFDARMMPDNLKYDLKAGRDYGYKPKFIRMKILHRILYYLIYEYRGENVSKIDQIERLRADGQEISEKMEREMGEIYSREVDWRMFIPPLPQHSGWNEGWAMICDVILRLPLSVFLEVHKLPFYIPDLSYYISHPIRKHYLMKDLPIFIRNALLMKRRYIYSIYETIQRLCYIGLLQFGPQKFKEKDQVFIYLNRRSELTDTTSSAPGYHKIEDKTYPVTAYTFDKLQAIENYWYDMWQICVCTRLGGRQAVEGTEITLEDLSKKPEMIQCLKPRLALEASTLDLGIMPGDKKGAAGIDSAFFSHLKRNWNWENFSTNIPFSKMIRKQPDRARNARLSKIEAKPIKFTEFKGLKKVTGPTNVSVSNSKTKKVKEKPAIAAPPKLVVTADTQRADKVVRRVMPRKRQKRKRVLYDDIDHTALQHMKKLRVDWDEREDNILLICKMVMVYLCPNPRNQLVSFPAVRDVLRTYSQNSHNKTSRACQRRLLYISKKPQMAHRLALGIEELKENHYLNKKYNNIIDIIRKTYNANEHDDKISNVFKTICNYVAKRHHISQKDTQESTSQPTTLGEFNLLYDISRPEQPYANQGFTKPIKNVNDIHSATINSVIFSSMCCGRDRRSWAYQLFRIYQQYPEILLKNAMTKIRADGMVSLKRYFKTVMKKIGSGSCMPMTSSQYQLSTTYVYKFLSKLPLELYRETQDFLQKLIDGYTNNSLGFERGVEIYAPNGGVILGAQELLACDNLDFNIKIPDHVIALDSDLQEYDKNYLRIAKRYQDILCNLERLETEQEKESKNETEREIPVRDELPSEVSIVAVKPPIKKFSFRKDSWGWPKLDTSNPNSSSNSSNNNDNNDRSNNNSDNNNTNDNNQHNVSRPVNKDYSFALDDSDDELEIKTTIDSRGIKITKSDIDNCKSSFIDNEMHEAFRQTRMDELDNVGSDDQEEDPREAMMRLVDQVSMGTSIDTLNRIVNDHIPMDIDDERVSKSLIRLGNLDPNGQSNKERGFFNENLNNENEESAESHKNNSNMVNDIIASVNRVSESRNQNRARDEDTFDTKKKHTRIALLQVREELNEKLHNLPDSHHAHEYFVVSTFGLYYSVPKIDSEIRADPDFVIDDKIKEDLFLLKNEFYKDVVKDLSKFAVFPKDVPDYESLKEDLETHGNIESVETELIYDYIRNKREQGATLKELTNKFYRILEEKLYDILSYMTDHRIFLRSGVTEMHYVHYHYAEPWYVQSIKILRLQRESLPHFPPGSVYVFNSANNYTESASVLDKFLSEKNNKIIDFGDSNENNDGNNDNNENIDDDNDNIDDDNDQDDIDHDSNDNDNDNMNIDINSDAMNSMELETSDMKLLNQKSTRANMRCLLQTKDIYTAVKKLDLNSAEKINVLVRPWVQIDGVINRMMLEKMLGAILSHCLVHPGITLSQVQTRFVPALQPYHTRELVEILAKLDCVTLRIIRKPPGTLFSNASSIKLYYPVRADGSSEIESEIIIEATIGATIKFGTFVRFYLSRKSNLNETTDTTAKDGETCQSED